MFLSVVLLFSPSLLSFCIYNRTSTYKNIKHKKPQRKTTNNKTTNKNRNLPAGTWEIFIRGRVEGWIFCISVLFVSLRVFMFFLFNVSLCFCLFSPSRFSFSIYNRTNTYTNIKTTTTTLKEKQKNNKKNKKQKSPSRNLRDIYSQSGRALDILYFFFFSFSFF